MQFALFIQVVIVSLGIKKKENKLVIHNILNHHYHNIDKVINIFVDLYLKDFTISRFVKKKSITKAINL